MTPEEYDNLEEGDIIRPIDGGSRYIINEVVGDHKTAKPTEHLVYVDKAKDWRLVSKKHPIPTPTPTPQDSPAPSTGSETKP